MNEWIKTAPVIGATSDIGRAMARKLAEDGRAGACCPNYVCGSAKAKAGFTAFLSGLRNRLTRSCVPGMTVGLDRIFRIKNPVHPIHPC